MMNAGSARSLTDMSSATAFGALLGLLGCGVAETPASPAGPVAAAVPEGPAVWLVESTAAFGIDFEHRSGAEGNFYFPEMLGGGVALFDLENDGDLDVLFVQSGSLDGPRPGPHHRLFRNLGDGRFEDASEAVGLDLVQGYGMGVAAGDVDGDGYTDLYVTNVGPNVLLHNLSGERLVDVAELAGVAHAGWGTSAAFEDFDADGSLDLFVVNYIHWSHATERECREFSGVRTYCGPQGYNAPAADVYYRNRGDGTFEDLSSELGFGVAFGNGLGVVCGDFTGDGRIDIFVANDRNPDQLWVQGEDGTFSDEASIHGVAVDRNGAARAGMGTDAIDVDGDGDLDLLVVNLHGEFDGFYRNHGTYFVEETARVGIGARSRPFTRFGVGFVDLDHDGWLDLYIANGRVTRMAEPYPEGLFAEPNMLLRGTPDGRWEEVLPRGGTLPMLVESSRGAAFGDLDGDGALDVVVVNRDGPAHVLRNVAPRGGGGFLARVLETSGRDALGAQVELVLADPTAPGGRRSLHRRVRAAHSYCASSDPRVHVGLGSATRIDAVNVRWVGGGSERFGPFAPDSQVVLQRGSGEQP